MSSSRYTPENISFQIRLLDIRRIREENVRNRKNAIPLLLDLVVEPPASEREQQWAKIMNFSLLRHPHPRSCVFLDPRSVNNDLLKKIG